MEGSGVNAVGESALTHAKRRVWGLSDFLISFAEHNIYALAVLYKCIYLYTLCSFPSSRCISTSQCLT